MVYVSVTGLNLKSRWHILHFFWHTFHSMRQAKKSSGNLKVELKLENGVYHTLSVWKDKAEMSKFISSGAHLKAMKNFGTIATGKTFGFSAETVPDWNEMRELWLKKGIER